MAVVDGTLLAMGHNIEIIDTRTGGVIFTWPTNRGGELAVAVGEPVVTYRHDGISGLV